MDETFRAILQGAVQSGASDIHLKPDAPVVFRVGRQLKPVDVRKPTLEWLNAVLQEIIPAHFAERYARDHEVDFAIAVEGLGRFRANAFQQRGVPTLALRVVKTQIRDFGELNLPEVLRRLAESPRGIVIIAGAIGSGKSTTLAAMIEHINRTSRRHVITLEDPIEFLFEDKQSIIEQREVGLDTPSYQSGLRHVLRQDPDVIVVGEMRDAESAAAAMSAANIGHLVITTLHTGDAVKSVARVLEFFPNEQREYARRLFAATLHGVVCQRLIPSTRGGVLPAVEVLLNNLAVSKAIEGNNLDKLHGTMELGNAEGMQTFDQALAQMVKAGRISRETAIAYAANPEMLRMAFQGVVLTEGGRILGSRDRDR